MLDNFFHINIYNTNLEQISDESSKPPSPFIQEQSSDDDNERSRTIIKKNDQLKSTIQEKPIVNESGKCDARKRCCGRENEIKSLIQGCSIGYRILDDNTTVQCIPDSCE